VAWPTREDKVAHRSGSVRVTSAMAIRAADVAPHAFGDGSELATADEVELDLGNLCAYGTDGMDPATLRVGREAQLLAAAQANVQALIRNLFLLPVKMSEAGPMVRVLVAAWTPAPRPCVWLRDMWRAAPARV
jgi:hypothetical protein